MVSKVRHTAQLALCLLSACCYAASASEVADKAFPDQLRDHVQLTYRGNETRKLLSQSFAKLSAVETESEALRTLLDFGDSEITGWCLQFARVDIVNVLREERSLVRRNLLPILNVMFTMAYPDGTGYIAGGAESNKSGRIAAIAQAVCTSLGVKFQSPQLSSRGNFEKKQVYRWIVATLNEASKLNETSPEQKLWLVYCRDSFTLKNSKGNQD